MKEIIDKYWAFKCALEKREFFQDVLWVSFSIKNQNHIYINTSLTPFSDMDRQGIGSIKISILENIRGKKVNDNDYLSVLLKNKSSTGNSALALETIIHTVFGTKYVLFIQDFQTIMLGAIKQSEEKIRSLWGNKAIWLPFTPGLTTLCSKIREVYGNRQDAIYLFVQNLGLFFPFSDPDKGLKYIDHLYQNIKPLLKKQNGILLQKREEISSQAAMIAPALRMLLMEHTTSVIAFNALNPDKYPVKRANYFLRLNYSAFTGQPLYIPYTGDIEILYNSIKQRVSQYKSKFKNKPRIIIIEKLGIFTQARDKISADLEIKYFLQNKKIKKTLILEQKCIPINMKHEKTWESELLEPYIRMTAKKQHLHKKLSGKIAIITGGAQGLGKGIAQALLNEGAYVVIADLNRKKAVETVQELQTLYGKEHSFFIQTDVTSEQSVKTLVHKTVLEYGGIDILVSNAGILKAGGLEHMNPETFKSVTDVNYTAYFICTKYVSEIMKIQSRFNSQYYTDIIQINSKSGLAGSKKNFAYAGSKFGSIGLTQSFALELVEYNIKVNSICPGNLFDGPLWSNPENGLFVQYLKTKKVPGAKRVEQVRKYYEAKVPMARGCTIEDVVCALFYIIEQKYETGQAVPVTGGQHMLK